MAAGVWTGVGFSNLKNIRTQIRIKTIWKRADSESEKVTPATSAECLKHILFEMYSIYSSFHWVMHVWCKYELLWWIRLVLVYMRRYVYIVVIKLFFRIPRHLMRIGCTSQPCGSAKRNKPCVKACSNTMQRVTRYYGTCVLAHDKQRNAFGAKEIARKSCLVCAWPSCLEYDLCCELFFRS